MSKSTDYNLPLPKFERIEISVDQSETKRLIFNQLFPTLVQKFRYVDFEYVGKKLTFYCYPGEFFARD